MKLLNAWNKLSLVKRIIIGVIQDSCETALNSSSDVLFTASAEYNLRRKAQTNN